MTVTAIAYEKSSITIRNSDDGPVVTASHWHFDGITPETTVGEVWDAIFASLNEKIGNRDERVIDLNGGIA